MQDLPSDSEEKSLSRDQANSLSVVWAVILVKLEQLEQFTSHKLNDPRRYIGRGGRRGENEKFSAQA